MNNYCPEPHDHSYEECQIGSGRDARGYYREMVMKCRICGATTGSSWKVYG